MKNISKVRNVTITLSLVLSVLLAVSAPLGYLIMSYEHQAAVLESEAEAAATFVSQLISANPEYWRFEQPRLEGFLSHRIADGPREIRRIVDLDHAVIAESVESLETPVIIRSHDLHDSGKVVARVEISRSFRPYLLGAMAFGLTGILLGSIVYYMLLMYPLAALDDALKSLQESEERFRAIASTAADGLVVMDNHGRIAFWNSAAEKMFGYASEEALGKGLHQLIAPPTYHEAIQQGYERFIATGQGAAIGNTVEFTALRKDGTELPIEVSTAAMNQAGTWHAVGIIRDIRERKKTEEELLKLAKLESLGLFAGGIAHDFNNLLTVVLGHVSIVQFDAEPSSEAYARLGDAERAIVRARDLTQQLLTFAKGGMPVKKTESIREIIEDACTLSLSGSRIKAEFSFAADLHPVEVDEGQISQVFHNLVLNAVQAMPHGGTIRVIGENIMLGPEDALSLVPGPYVSIVVKDQGVGIPKEQVAKIFDPYFTTKQKGSGLGLATCFAIIKKHDGTISVDSEFGAGTSFRILLPASQNEVAARKTNTKDPVLGTGRVLVMDDEEEVRLVAGAMLKKLGYEPAFAQDGAEALACYRSAAVTGMPFQAVIMDLTIPGGMGGSETIGKLLEFDSRARVLVASGYSNDPVMAEFKAHGFSGVIAKPYTVDMLGMALSTLTA